MSETARKKYHIKNIIAMKTNIILTAVAVLPLLVSCGASRQSVQQTQPDETAISGTEAKVKEWQSKGFSVTGAMSTFTMYDLLEMHNKKILADPDNIVPAFGTGIGADKATAQYAALNNAATMYATKAGSVVSGGMSNQFSTFGEQGNKLMGAYTQKVQEYIMPIMRESLSVSRIITENVPQKGRYEVESYYIIDESKAAEARRNAMKEALEETATEQIFGDAVDAWVKEFVRPDAE